MPANPSHQKRKTAKAGPGGKRAAPRKPKETNPFPLCAKYGLKVEFDPVPHVQWGELEMFIHPMVRSPLLCWLTNRRVTPEGPYARAVEYFLKKWQGQSARS